MSKIDNPVVVTILGYLVQDLRQFFSDPPSCLMIYRILPEVSKNLILRVINSTQNGKIDTSDIKSHDIFINTEKNISQYIVGLRQLGIILKDEDKNVIHFNELFISTMRKVLSEGIKNENNISFHRKPKGYENSLERGINKFYKFINEKIFDQIGKTRTDNYINTFLTKNQLLHIVEDRYKLGSHSINLFLHVTEEMIKLLFYLYLTFCYEKNYKTEKKIKFAKFLFYLTTLEPGAYFTEFPSKYYDPSFEEHIDFMHQTGYLIIKQDKTDDKKITKKYCSTPLIQCLFENNNISKAYSILKYGDENAERFLFVETNMRFYAYMPYVKKVSKNKDGLNTSLNLTMTSSTASIYSKDEKEEKVQDQKTLFNINLLKTIFNIEIILPNMLIGYITRECLRKLFKDTKSELILQFLSEHMSLKCDDITEINGKKYLINESVVNQIQVLEREKNSIIYKPVLCYYDFYNKEQFAQYAKTMEENQINCIYCHNDIIVFTDTQENKRRMERIENKLIIHN